MISNYSSLSQIKLYLVQIALKFRDKENGIFHRSWYLQSCITIHNLRYDNNYNYMCCFNKILIIMTF